MQVYQNKEGMKTMPKITSVQNGVVSVQTANGEIQNFQAADLSFTPTIGDEVEILHYNGKDTLQKRTEMYNTYTPPVNHPLNKKRVNKIAYCLLAFFLGLFGAHKFYAGKIGLGIVYLLFCWTFIPGIVAFVEMIIGISKEADAYGNILV